MPKQEALEGEIVTPSDVQRDYNNAPPDQIINQIFPGWRLLLCLLPIFGLLFGIIWYYYEKSKKRITVIYPIIGIVLGLFTTSTFVVLRFILKTLF